jgi:8-oxo-dGTP pyrophosphatase MutT (NUDIX family)
MPESESPETTISSERVYEGKRISVRLEHVRLIDGTESTRDIVDHPNAVVILAVDDDSNILFVRQYRKAPEVELLELPAGVMDTGETDPAKSAQRELREETGHAAGSLIQLGSFYSPTTLYPWMTTNESRLSECRSLKLLWLLGQEYSRIQKRWHRCSLRPHISRVYSCYLGPPLRQLQSTLPQVSPR